MPPSPSDSPEKGIERFAHMLMRPDHEGDWVRYKDHIRERDEAVAGERERTREALRAEFKRLWTRGSLSEHGYNQAVAALDSLEDA